MPIVATNEAYFASPDDYEAHDALLCIAEGRYVVEDDRRRVTREHYFKSAEEMAELFADLPEALANTVEIAKRCAFRPKGRKPILPRFVAGDDGVSETEQSRLEAAELRRQAEQGLRDRLAAAPPAPGFTVDDYEKRLAYEVDVITQMKFPGYFLIVADFIKWSKAQRHPRRAGPRLGRRLGRRLGADHHRSRSAALRPAVRALPQSRARVDARLRHRLLPGPARRGDPLRAAESTAHDRVAQIITHGKLQARAVLRDVGRVLQMPYGQVDRLCKLVPNNPANPVTLPEAIDGEPKLQEERDREPMVARLLEIAAEARRPLPPRLDARRRHGDRRPAARRAGAALRAIRSRTCPSPSSTGRWSRRRAS